MDIMRALLVSLLFLTTYAHAFTWQDLWLTKDQQGKALMDKGQFKQAKETFLRDDWRAASAYRAGDYEKAAKIYPSIKNEDAYYNEGNTLAHMGKYEQAMKAYDKTLAINPDNQDALYNRKIVEKLLKKDKQQQQNQDQQNQDKQNQDKQNQDQQNQDKQNQDKQNQDQQNQDKQNQDQQNQDQQNQDKQNQDKQNQDKQNQDKQAQDKQAQKKKEQERKNNENSAQSNAAREQKQANEQWLRLIPDDPGGLLREKFLRDHLRRQQGWD
jgi:Ca-activated chloride channel family protein